MKYLIIQNRDNKKVPIFYTREKETRDVILNKIPNTEYIETLDPYYYIPYGIKPAKEDIELLKIPKFMKVYRISKYGYEKDLIIRYEMNDVYHFYGNRYMSGRESDILNTGLYNCILDSTKGGCGCLLYESFLLAKDKEEARRKYNELLEEGKYVYSWADVFAEEYCKYRIKINSGDDRIVKIYSEWLERIQKGEWPHK